MPDASARKSDPALKGLRVVDFSHALAGPYCTLLLSEYGADVFKIEAPGGSDMARGWGPPFAGEYSSFFLGLNRGKHGVAIDLKHAEGVEVCRRLIDSADVVVENFRPGTMDRLGLGYAALRARNPRIVYCSISGYGQAGPSRDEAAMDLIVQCSSGLVSITGTEAGTQVRSGFSVADVSAGMFATIGVLMALRARDQHGLGQLVDVSMFDGMISAMTSNYMTFLGSGNVPKPMGTSFSTVVPYTVFESADRKFSIAVGSEKLWAMFCDVIGRSDLLNHPDYATNPDRVKYRRQLESVIGAEFEKQPMAHWLEKLRAAGIPCSPVMSFDEVAAHPQASFREMFPEVELGEKSYRVTGEPFKLSESQSGSREPAPLPGQHTAKVLESIGVTKDELASLLNRNVVAGA